MKSLFFYTVTMFLLSVQVSNAQDEEENIGFTQYSSSVFDSKQNALNLVSRLPSSPSEQTFIPTGILIQQVGDFNAFSANLKTENVSISLLQNGNDNSVMLDKEAKSISQKIIQNGDSNQITDFTYYTKYDVNMQMIQQGSNQNIQNYGTNSLSKDMTVTQTGNGAAVIIINQ